MKKFSLLLSILAAVAFIFISCEKDEENQTSLPTLSTLDVTEIMQTTATSGGNITNDGGAFITDRGVVWATSAKPDLEHYDGITYDGKGTGMYSSTLTGLQPETIYYVRSYAANSAGTAYGQQEQFTTDAAGEPAVAAFTATPTSGIAPLTVNFTDQSTNNPTSWQWDFGDGHSSDQQNPDHTYQSAGDYTVQLTVSTAYGSDTETKTDYIIVESDVGAGQPCPGTPTVTDIDGNVYNTVLIGDQCWMKENLKTTKYRNGEPIEYPGSNNTVWFNNTSGAYAWYDNDISYKDIYGALYNWYAVNNANGLCPSGWYVPSDEEWKILEGTVDSLYDVGHEMWNGTDWRGSDVGKKLKATSGWIEDGNGTDDYGFAALPSASRYFNGYFGHLNIFGSWWSATEHSSTTYAWRRNLHADRDKALRWNKLKESGLSVRCLKID